MIRSQPLALATLALLAGGAQAQTELAVPAPAPIAAPETARVISSTPLLQAVQVQRQVCNPAVVAPAAAPSSGAGALVGAIAGGVVGNALGGGAGRALATGLGVVGGAMLGDQLEARNNAPVPATACHAELSTEHRQVGYTVVYEYASRQYSAVLPQDPGPTLPVQVAPQVPVVLPPPVNSSTTVLPLASTAAPVTVATPVVYGPPVAYGYPSPYYPAAVGLAVGVGLGWGAHWGHRPGYGHRWR